MAKPNVSGPYRTVVAGAFRAVLAASTMLGAPAAVRAQTTVGIPPPDFSAGEAAWVATSNDYIALPFGVGRSP